MSRATSWSTFCCSLPYKQTIEYLDDGQCHSQVLTSTSASNQIQNLGLRMTPWKIDSSIKYNLSSQLWSRFPPKIKDIFKAFIMKTVPKLPQLLLRIKEDISIYDNLKFNIWNYHLRFRRRKWNIFSYKDHLASVSLLFVNKIGGVCFWSSSPLVLSSLLFRLKLLHNWIETVFIQ